MTLKQLLQLSLLLPKNEVKRIKKNAVLLKIKPKEYLQKRGSKDVQ